MEVTKIAPLAGEYMLDFRSLAFGRPLTFSTEDVLQFEGETDL